MRLAELVAAVTEAYRIRESAAWQQARLMAALYELHSPLPLQRDAFLRAIGYEFSPRSSDLMPEVWRLRVSGVYVPELSIQHHIAACRWERPMFWLGEALAEGWTPNNMRVQRSRDRHPATISSPDA